MTAYCVSCKQNVTTQAFQVKKTDSGRQMIHGQCPQCLGPIQRLLGPLPTQGINV